MEGSESRNLNFHSSGMNKLVKKVAIMKRYQLLRSFPLFFWHAFPSTRVRLRSVWVRLKILENLKIRSNEIRVNVETGCV